MAKSTLKVGDRVQILSNDLQPQTVGKIGKVKKVYESFSENCDCMFMYRIELDGFALRGVASALDLKKV